MFARHAERLAARGEDAETRAALEQRFDERGAGVHQVLAAVQDDERRPLAQMVHHRFHGGPSALFAKAERGGDHLADECGVGEAGQVHPARALKSRRGARGHLGREPGLAAAADSRERQEADGAQQVTHRRDLHFTADERRELDGNAYRRDPKGA